MLKKTDKLAKVIIDGKEFKLPILKGTEEEYALDIRTLRNESSYITFDPGYANTGATESNITFLDGEAGVLRYRGYSIESLASKASFLEVAWLLFYGNLPTKDELVTLNNRIINATPLDNEMQTMLKSFPKDAHPMAMISAALMALSGQYNDYLKAYLTKEEKDFLWIELIAKMSSIVAYIFRLKQGKEDLPVFNKDTYEDNLLAMMFSSKNNEYVSNIKVSEALRVLLILLCVW